MADPSETSSLRVELENVKRERDAVLAKNKDLEEACRWIVALTSKWTLTPEEDITVARAKKALGELVEGKKS